MRNRDNTSMCVLGTSEYLVIQSTPWLNQLRKSRFSILQPLFPFLYLCHSFTCFPPFCRISSLSLLSILWSYFPFPSSLFFTYFFPSLAPFFQLFISFSPDSYLIHFPSYRHSSQLRLSPSLFKLKQSR